MTFVQRHKGILPLALLLPGLAWLIIFFALPLYYQGKISLETGSIFNGYHFNWHFSNYTLAWETILDDSSPLVSILQTLHIISPNGRVLATTGSVVAGITYNFLPFMILPLYASLERIDSRLL